MYTSLTELKHQSTISSDDSQERWEAEKKCPAIVDEAAAPVSLC